MKVLFLSDDEWNIECATHAFGVAKGAFQLHVVHEAREIMEDTDFEDPSTVIYLDMAHSQTDDLMKELHRTGLSKKLILGALCRPSHMQEDIIFAAHYGAQFVMRPKLDLYRIVPEYLLKVREERGLT